MRHNEAHDTLVCSAAARSKANQLQGVVAELEAYRATAGEADQLRILSAAQREELASLREAQRQRAELGSQLSQWEAQCGTCAACLFDSQCGLMVITHGCYCCIGSVASDTGDNLLFYVDSRTDCASVSSFFPPLS